MLVNATDALTTSSPALTAGASAQAIGANPDRSSLSISLSFAATAPLFLLLGAGTASATNFHICVPAGQLWNGLVGTCLWRGAVQAFSTAGGAYGLAEV